MGRIKQMLLQQTEFLVNEIEDITAQAEDEIALSGKISEELQVQLAKAFYEYGKVWPEDDMATFGKALIAAIAIGSERYTEKLVEQYGEIGLG